MHRHPHDESPLHSVRDMLSSTESSCADLAASRSYDDVLSSEDPTLSDCWRTSWDDEQADTDTGRSFRTSTGNQALSGNGAGPLHSSSEHDGADPPASTAQPQDAGRSILKQQQQLQQQASTFTRSLARLASNLVPPWVKSKFTPKLRGLVLLNLLVVLVATNWCVLSIMQIPGSCFSRRSGAKCAHAGRTAETLLVAGRNALPTRPPAQHVQ